jgi:alpha-L-rhamnosidase
MYGTVFSSWQKKRDGLMLDIRVPANTTATIHLPAGKGASVTEGGKALSGIKGIKILTSSENEVVVEVGSGVYSFFISKH